MNKLNNLTKRMRLKEVKLTDAKFLFELLQNRNPKANISHKKMPTYKQHLNFIKSKPYSKWYIIYFEKKKVGSVYLSKNDEIGIFLIPDFQNSGLGGIILNQIITRNPRDRYLANVNPKNTKSANFFKKNGFRLIQHTYELIHDEETKNQII